MRYSHFTPSYTNQAVELSQLAEMWKKQGKNMAGIKKPVEMIL